MSRFLPGHHWQAQAKVLEFDPVSQTGKVQLMGIYGRDAQGTPTPTAVGTKPDYVREGSHLARICEPQAVYLPGEWVLILGCPAGPTGESNLDDIRAGVTFKGFETAYYIVGRLTYQPPEHHLDHAAAIQMEGTGTPFPSVRATLEEHEKG